MRSGVLCGKLLVSVTETTGWEKMHIGDFLRRFDELTAYDTASASARHARLGVPTSNRRILATRLGTSARKRVRRTIRSIRRSGFRGFLDVATWSTSAKMGSGDKFLGSDTWALAENVWNMEGMEGTRDNFATGIPVREAT